MKNEFLRHKTAYILLGILLIVLSTAFLLVWPDRNYQRLISIVMGVIYFLWGIIVHTKSDHLTAKIVIEYGLVSLLATTLLILITI